MEASKQKYRTFCRYFCWEQIVEKIEEFNRLSVKKPCLHICGLGA